MVASPKGGAFKTYDELHKPYLVTAEILPDGFMVLQVLSVKSLDSSLRALRQVLKHDPDAPLQRVVRVA